MGSGRLLAFTSRAPPGKSGFSLAKIGVPTLFAHKPFGPLLLRQELQALLLGGKPGGKLFNIKGFNQVFHTSCERNPMQK